MSLLIPGAVAGAALVDGAVAAGGGAGEAPGELVVWAKASAGRVSMAAKAAGAMRGLMMDRSRVKGCWKGSGEGQ
jgi:hypothetical protein